MIWLELCTTCSSSCHHHFNHPLLHWTPANPGSSGKWPLKRRERLSRYKPGKQTVYGLKCCLEKCHKDIYRLYMRMVESRQQGPPAKRRNWTRYWRRIVGLTWLLNVWKRTLILSGDFHFCYVHFRFRFVIGRKWNFIFVCIFVYGRKWKMLFGRPLVYIKKRSWSWDCGYGGVHLQDLLTCWR